MDLPLVKLGRALLSRPHNQQALKQDGKKHRMCIRKIAPDVPGATVDAAAFWFLYFEKRLTQDPQLIKQIKKLHRILGKCLETLREEPIPKRFPVPEVQSLAHQLELEILSLVGRSNALIDFTQELHLGSSWGRPKSIRAAGGSELWREEDDAWVQRLWDQVAERTGRPRPKPPLIQSTPPFHIIPPVGVARDFLIAALYETFYEAAPEKGTEERTRHGTAIDMTLKALEARDYGFIRSTDPQIVPKRRSRLLSGDPGQLFLASIAADIFPTPEADRRRLAKILRQTRKLTASDKAWVHSIWHR